MPTMVAPFRQPPVKSWGVLSILRTSPSEWRDAVIKYFLSVHHVGFALYYRSLYSADEPRKGRSGICVVALAD